MSAGSLLNPLRNSTGRGDNTVPTKSLPPSSALIVAAVGAVGTIIAVIFSPRALLQAWLVGFVFVIGLPLGALALLMAHDLTGGRWGRAAAPALRRAAATLPLAALAVLPILLWPGGLYPWADPRIAATLPNAAWLGTGFFIVRSVVVLALWSLLAVLYLWRIGRAGRAPGLAAAGLILLFSTSTMMAFDWLMSLEPSWQSSIFGLLVGAGHLLAALAAASLATASPEIGRPTTRETTQALADLGSLMVAASILWVYLHAMQYVIIWEANLPREIVWYLPRGQGRWAAAALLMLVAQFLVPVLLLIWKPLKERPAILAAVAASVLVGHGIEAAWLVLPEFPGSAIRVAPFPLLLLGGSWFALLLRRGPA